MTLVLEESEDISQGLLAPILDAVKNNNEVIYCLSHSLKFFFHSLF